MSTTGENVSRRLQPFHSRNTTAPAFGRWIFSGQRLQPAIKQQGNIQ